MFNQEKTFTAFATRSFTGLSFSKIRPLLFIIFFTSVLSACSSSDDDDSEGYIKFYNASPDSPSIYLTLDEDLDEDTDDEFEQTFSPVAYGKAGSRISLESRSYFYELAWQNEESSARTDLEIVDEGEIQVNSDNTHWIIMTDSIQAPQVLTISIPTISDDQSDQDAEDSIFNLRMINLHSDVPDVDIYASDTDQTFSEATLLANLALNTVSDNFRLDRDQYKFYITLSGEENVLFTSDEINYAFGGQFLLALRENIGTGGSPFVMDNIGTSTIVQYDALESTANISVYNGLSSSSLVTDYAEAINVEIQGPTDIDDITELEYGDFSESYVVESGDYRFNVINTENDSFLLQNRVLSLAKNTNKTLFLYWTEEEVDDDNDGNVDENEDGVVDEIRPVVSTLSVDNSNRSRLYDKEIKLLNLVTSDDFRTVTVYFVKSDEIIDTAENSRNLAEGSSSSVILLNNTYQVLVVASIDNNDIILDDLSLTLSEETKDLFLILEQSDQSPSGYAIRIVDQVSVDISE